MLYPDFYELISFKKRKSTLTSPSSRTMKSAISGNYQSAFRGQGLDFDSVRKYVPGDDIRNIDWRVTARMDSPHLKLFKEERERHTLICVDMNASMRFGTRNTFKSVQAARIAALLGWKSMEHQDRVSAYLFGDIPKGSQYFPPKRTQKSFCHMLKLLSQPPQEQHTVPLSKIFQPLIQMTHSGSLIYVISDFMDVDADFQNTPGLNLLSKQSEIVFISINDPADQTLFPMGEIEFCNAKSEKIIANTDSLTGREAYATQWKKNRESLKEVASRLKIPLVELSTTSDIHREMILGLKYLAKRKKR